MDKLKQAEHSICPLQEQVSTPWEKDLDNVDLLSFFLFLKEVLPEFYYLGFKIILNKMLLKPNPGLVRLVNIMSYY